jgi:hypothetical protein
MPFSIAALATEINGDPNQYDYATPKAAGSDSGILALLNGPAKNSPTVWRTSVPVAELLACIVWAEVSAFSAAKAALAQWMFATGAVDASSANVRGFFAGAFSGATQTIANMTATAKVSTPTRAEELWGAGTIISKDDVAKALGRG